MAREDLDLFYDPPSSRWPRIIFFLTLFAVLVAGAWVFAPPLMAKFAPGLTAKIETSLPKFSAAQQTAMPRPANEADAEPRTAKPAPPEQPAAAPQPLNLAMAPAANEAAETAPQAPPPAVIAAPAFAPTPPSPPETTAASPIPSAWPPPLAADNGGTTLAAATANDPVEALETVPLPRRRPSSLTIAARTAIPLPRPRPEIASDEPTPEQISTELQVDRMR